MLERAGLVKSHYQTSRGSLPFAQKWYWLLLGALADLRIRYGIKLGLAALLALYCALWLRLEHPSWAVLTALVMMGSHYVGSIAVKAIMRVRSWAVCSMKLSWSRPLFPKSLTF